MAEITLYQFPSSHFNEKARWGLDVKRVPHDRISLIPGPHAPRMQRLTGKTLTPALVDGDEVAVDVADLGGPALSGTEEENVWLAHWENHPGTAWVQEIYRRHRRP